MDSHPAVARDHVTATAAVSVIAVPMAAATAAAESSRGAPGLGLPDSDAGSAGTRTAGLGLGRPDCCRAASAVRALARLCCSPPSSASLEFRADAEPIIMAVIVTQCLDN